ISEGLGVNGRNQIVGVSFAAGFANPRAFLYQNGHMTDLNTLAPNSPVYLQVAGNINDSGVIVGQGCRPDDCAAGAVFVSFIAVPTGDGKYQVNVTGAPSHANPHMTSGALPAGPYSQRVAFGKVTSN